MSVFKSAWDVLIKAKELEEKQRKEVESRLRTALRIQARQQTGLLIRLQLSLQPGQSLLAIFPFLI
jgi:hypothetical protein